MYGDKRDYKKINFYDKKTGKYLCSTTWARTCKEAMEHYIHNDPYNIGITALGIKASYK
jgi:hypothetical protein